MRTAFPTPADAQEIDLLATEARNVGMKIDAHLAKLGVSISLDNFFGSAAGRWTIQVPKGWSLFLYNFSISVINLSHGSWIATGNSTGRTGSSAEYDFPWSIECDGSSDSMKVTVWGKTQVFEKVSSADSPIAWEYNYDSKRFVFLIRRDSLLGDFKILKGAYISASEV